MKILSVTPFKTTLGMIATVSALTLTPKQSQSQNVAQTSIKRDTFTCVTKIPPEGTSDKTALFSAPNPNVTVKGEPQKATLVVDLSKNVLYHYDENGNAISAYLVASGKKSSPTETGLRVVSHIETYPYRSAHASTKRRKKPWDYGPRIICLEKLDSITGKRSSTGEFIHGNNNPKSIGKYASLGCIRMDNTVIKQLAKEVKRGALVLIKK